MILYVRDSGDFELLHHLASRHRRLLGATLVVSPDDDAPWAAAQLPIAAALTMAFTADAVLQELRRHR